MINLLCHQPFSADQANSCGDRTENEDDPAKRVASPEPADERIIESRTPSTYPRSMRSKANSSASSYQTNDTSLVALQTKGAEDGDALEPLLEEEIEPGSFDLVIPAHGDGGLYSLEKRSELLFSKQHLAVIFEDPALLQHFTTFLCTSRASSVPLLVYYLDAVKALKAISYSNAVIEALIPLEGHDFSGNQATTTVNESLKAKADAAFEALARDDLPAYITHVWIQKVSVSIRRRISGTLPAHLRDMSEGLAEVFCLTDPSRHDNPIVFASEGKPLYLHGSQSLLTQPRIPSDNPIWHELCAWQELSVSARSKDQSLRHKTDS